MTNAHLDTFLPLLVILAISVILIIKQPDLGTGLMFSFLDSFSSGLQDLIKGTFRSHSSVVPSQHRFSGNA